MTLQAKSSTLVRVFFQPINLGIFGNLNFLANQARSNLIQILCQDDCLSSADSLALLLHRWQNFPVAIGASRWNSHETKMAINSNSRIDPPSSQLQFFLRGNIPGNLSNVAFRKSAWMAVGPFDQRYPYAGDFYYWALFTLSFSFALLPETGVCVRQHPGQASKHLNKDGELYDQLSEITTQIYERIPRRNWLSNSALRLSGTLVYDSAYRRSLLKQILRLDFSRYRRLAKSSSKKSYLVSPMLRWVFFFITAGGSIGKKLLLDATLKLNTSKV